MVSPLNTKDLRRIFKSLDQNGDGLVSVEELIWLLAKIGVPQLTLQELESLVGKPILNLEEFLSFCSSIAKQNNDKNNEEVLTEDKGMLDQEDGDLLEAFNVFDLNKDGFISCKELENVLSRLGLWDENGKGKDTASMIRKYDTNFDGLIDLEEFKKMMFRGE